MSRAGFYQRKDMKSVLIKRCYSCLDPHVFTREKEEVKRREGAIGVIIHCLVHKPSHTPQQRGYKGAYRDNTTDKWHWFKSRRTSLSKCTKQWGIRLVATKAESSKERGIKPTESPTSKRMQTEHHRKLLDTEKKVVVLAPTVKLDQPLPRFLSPICECSRWEIVTSFLSQFNFVFVETGNRIPF